MVKSREDVIAQFHEEVNMTADELEKWLEDPKSSKAGTGVGIESGHKIVEILRKNPDRDPEQYDEQDIEHMRKVVGYTKRHIAQEDHLKETKSREELENTKSTISLKNWGHDPVKTLDGAEERQSEEADGQPQSESQVGDSNKPEPKPKGAAHKQGADKRETNKRKLEGGAAEVENDEVDAVGEASEDRADVDEEDEQGDRPRKKSKVDGDS